MNGMMRTLVLLLMTAPLLAGVGCGREYSQATPDDVLLSARAMVENGDVHRLPDLVYADSEEMRELLTEFGRVMSALQSLTIELHRTFPDEIAKIRAEAEEAAERGEATSLVGRMMGGQMQARRRGGQDPGDRRAAFDQSIKELFADPYGWLERSEGRITTQYVADDLSAILWDDKPAFGIGMLMKQERGKWYIMLPTNMPGLGRVAPQSEEMWEIGKALATALENAIRDTQRDVRAGKHASMQDLARDVGEKAALPALAIGFAYQRAMQIERQEQRERQREAREEAQRARNQGNEGS